MCMTVATASCCWMTLCCGSAKVEPGLDFFARQPSILVFLPPWFFFFQGGPKSLFPHISYHFSFISYQIHTKTAIKMHMKMVVGGYEGDVILVFLKSWLRPCVPSGYHTAKLFIYLSIHWPKCRLTKNTRNKRRLLKFPVKCEEILHVHDLPFKLRRRVYGGGVVRCTWGCSATAVACSSDHTADHTGRPEVLTGCQTWWK